MTEKAMQFQYGDRQLTLSVGNLIDAPVEVICHATDSALTHETQHAKTILSAAGPESLTECAQLIRQYQSIDSGMAVYTSAGQLPQKALIHVVISDNPDEQQALLERSIARSLMICDTNEWQSIAFHALGVENGDISLNHCAQAFFRSITSFWDARLECAVDTVILKLAEHEFETFFHAFRNESMQEDSQITENPESTHEPETAEVNLEDLQTELPNENDEISDWFK